MNLTKKILLWLFSSAIVSYTWVFAAWIDHFEVEFNLDKAMVGESLDLTIEAVDKNNETVLDYNGTILIFSESDPEAELPSELSENTYVFSASDQWVIKFENSVIFKEAWLQDIHIYDLNDDSVFWIAEAEIDEKVELQNIDIDIITPENGLTIWKNTIWVSWTTKKNHKVTILLNWSNEFVVTSNSDWIYEKTVDNLKDWENTFKSMVYDSEWNVIGESEEVTLTVELNSLNIKSINVTPENVDPEDSYQIEVITNSKLDEVSVIINDVLTTLEETTSWVYTAKLVWEKEAWIYKIDIKIKDELWHEKTELWAASIKINEIELTSASSTWANDNNNEVIVIDEDAKECSDNEDLKISWLKLVELKTKSILTWNRIADVESYNVYIKSESWEFELITNVTEPKFQVEITWDEIKYNHFAVKAVWENECWDTFEWTLSDATKVKTGPELLILFVLSLLIGWGILVMKQKNA